MLFAQRFSGIKNITATRKAALEKRRFLNFLQRQYDSNTKPGFPSTADAAKEIGKPLRPYLLSDGSKKARGALPRTQEVSTGLQNTSTGVSVNGLSVTEAGPAGFFNPLIGAGISSRATPFISEPTLPGFQNSLRSSRVSSGLSFAEPAPTGFSNPLMGAGVSSGGTSVAKTENTASGVVPQKMRVKTTGKSFHKITKEALNRPVELLPSELWKVIELRNTNNTFVKNWRKRDISHLPQGLKSRLNKCYNIIGDHMTPPDLAAIFKEERGIKIFDPKTGDLFNHVKEWAQARNGLINHFADISKMTEKLNRADTELVQEKINLIYQVYHKYEHLTDGAAQRCLKKNLLQP